MLPSPHICLLVHTYCLWVTPRVRQGLDSLFSKLLYDTIFFTSCFSLMGVQLCSRLLLWTLTYLWSKLFTYCMSRHVLFLLPSLFSVYGRKLSDWSLHLKENKICPLLTSFCDVLFFLFFWRHKIQNFNMTHLLSWKKYSRISMVDKSTTKEKKSKVGIWFWGVVICSLFWFFLIKTYVSEASQC